MISFRQHVVTLVAVFLALAVGVVLGGGPLSEVGRDALTSTSAKTKSASDNDATAFGDAFATAAATRLYDEQLAGRSVALVSLPGTDQRIIDGLVGQVEHAGGTLEGTYALQRALVDPGEKSLVDTLGSQLMTQLDSGAADENAPTYERLGQLLGAAIATEQEDGADVGGDTPSIRQSLAGADLVVSPEKEVGRAPLVLVVLGHDTDDNILSGLMSGLASRAVYGRHVLANALPPLVVLLALSLPGVVAGSVFVESVFAWPGMGRAMVMAISARDYPVVMGATLLYAALVILANLAADLVLPLIDPRRDA